MALREITWDELGFLKVDDNDGRLYWKDKAVRFEKKVSLQGYQIALATMGAVGAVMAGIHPFGHSFGWW